MGWENDYEHWRDKGHTWGPGIDDYEEPTEEERLETLKMMQNYEKELEKLRVNPREEFVLKGKELDRLWDEIRYPAKYPDSGTTLDDVRSVTFNACKDAAESLGYSFSLRDREKENPNTITVAVEFIGTIPERAGNLHQYTVSGIENPNDALQLVEDFFVLGRNSITYYKNHFICMDDSGMLRKEMENWGINFENSSKEVSLDYDNKIRKGEPGMNVKNEIDERGFMKLCLDEFHKLPGNTIKSWEVAIQNAVENIFPDTCWYDVTGVPVFDQLLSGDAPMTVCTEVWQDVKKELSRKEPLAEKIRNAEQKTSTASVKDAKLLMADRER